MLAQGTGRENVLFWQGGSPGNKIPGFHSLLPGHSREIQTIIRGKKVWGVGFEGCSELASGGTLV